MTSGRLSKNQDHVILIALLIVFSLVAGSCQPQPEIGSTEAPGLPEGTIMVTSTADSGPGSLRQAMQAAREGDMIVFDPGVFPPESPVTIYVSSEELPHIRVNNLTLDACDAGVILDGSQLSGDWIAGLQIVSSDGNTIMGFQISHFPGPGIAISGESSHNLIGGDRGLGSGPYGQGNMISNNVVGIDLSTQGTTLNTIRGNYIGTNLEGSRGLRNEREAIQISEGAHDNAIEPDNIFTDDEEDKVYAQYWERDQLAPPSIFDHDLSTGIVLGASCPNCTVEIYSTSAYEGEILEGETTTDENGIFRFEKGETLAGPSLTARASDADRRESHFTFPPTMQDFDSLLIQSDNEHPRKQFFVQLPETLEDNHIATQYDGISYEDDFTDFHIYNQGVTRVRLSLSGLEPELVDWDKPEFSISEAQERHLNRMADNDVIVTYVLMFWDKETWPGGQGAPCARFKTEEEIERWLEYVRFIVENLKDRVEYFEIWNEPDIRNYCPKWIELNDYVNLVRVTAPVIREQAPEARIVVGAVSYTFYEQDYLFRLLQSDVMPLVDVISWHPMYGTSPKYDRFRSYYYNYPDFVGKIKDTASAHGFAGEYHADELSWNIEPREGQSPQGYSPIEKNKYFLRGALMHRGMDIDIGLGSGYFLIQRLSALLAGVEPAKLQVEVDSSADRIATYTFSTPEGGHLVAVWNDGVALENDPGLEATVSIPGYLASDVAVIDIFENLRQALNFDVVDGTLVIPGLLIRDYPLVLHLNP